MSEKLMYGGPRPPRRGVDVGTPRLDPKEIDRLKKTLKKVQASTTRRHAVEVLGARAQAFEEASELIRKAAGEEFAAGRDEVAKRLRVLSEETKQLGEAARLQQRACEDKEGGPRE